MTKKIIIIVVIVLAATGAGLLIANSGCKGSECPLDVTTTTAPSEPSLVEQVESALQNTEALLIDVRTPQEYATGHAKDAVNVPLDNMQNGIYPEANKDAPLYVYCRSGNRSAQAKAILDQAGFTNVIDIGGLSDWQSQGGEVVGS